MARPILDLAHTELDTAGKLAVIYYSYLASKHMACPSED
jgi:hypothetical protein